VRAIKPAHRLPVSSIKGEVKEKYLACAFQPLALSRIVLAFRSMSSVRYVLLRSSFGFLSQRFSSHVRDKSVSFETNKQNGGQVPTMVLSETRGP
jgi:hypothetical protein